MTPKALGVKLSSLSIRAALDKPLPASDAGRCLRSIRQCILLRRMRLELAHLLRAGPILVHVRFRGYIERAEFVVELWGVG